jgi:NADH:ubiquinone oxidoreductase subunit 5 (subunit L)/multisubunit Na+/H+ antiporter MnhA subunit
LSFVHLVVHALFKSTLFLRSGSLIRQLSGGQDSRFFGDFVWGGSSFLFFLVSCLCLGGFPFVVGFYSKDYVLGCSFWMRGFLLGFFFFISCGFTVVYRFRLVKMGFVGGVKSGGVVGFREGRVFFSSVVFLFLICCFRGVSVFWFFLTGVSFFFRSCDMIMGVILLLGGVAFSFFLVFFYSYFWFFGLIGFLKWVRSGGTSFLFSKAFLFRGEGSWLEEFGGRGVYDLLFWGEERFSNFFGWGLKTLGVSVFLVGWYLFFCTFSFVRERLL